MNRRSAKSLDSRGSSLVRPPSTFRGSFEPIGHSRQFSLCDAHLRPIVAPGPIRLAIPSKPEPWKCGMRFAGSPVRKDLRPPVWLANEETAG